MNPSDADVLKVIKAGELQRALRGDECVFFTPSDVNDDMRPTDHVELLEKGLYPLARTHGSNFVQKELEQALRGVCVDALGVFCAHQCFYMEIISENAGRSPLVLNRESLPKYLADAFFRESTALHSIEVRAGDLANDRSYKVTLSRMRILARDYGIDWGAAL